MYTIGWLLSSNVTQLLDMVYLYYIIVIYVEYINKAKLELKLSLCVFGFDDFNTTSCITLFKSHVAAKLLTLHLVWIENSTWEGKQRAMMECQLVSSVMGQNYSDWQWP